MRNERAASILLSNPSEDRENISTKCRQNAGDMLMSSAFAHETSVLYQQALEFAKWCEGILDRAPKNSASYGQLDQARTTTLLKVAAAAGSGTTGERTRAAELAQTAAVECAACLDLMFNKRIVSRDELQRGKENLQRVIASLAEAPGFTPPFALQTKAA